MSDKILRTIAICYKIIGVGNMQIRVSVILKLLQILGHVVVLTVEEALRD